MKSYIVALLLIASLNGYAQPKIGEQVQEIALKNAKGETEKLSDLRGKLVLIDFWASWCGPCRHSNKDLMKLYSKYKTKGFEIYGISIDDNAEAWKKAIASDHITWKQVNEQGGWESSLANAWKIEVIPSSFLLDKEGKVIARDPTPGEIERYLKKKQ
jgi:peroxiredoxin